MHLKSWTRKEIQVGFYEVKRKVIIRKIYYVSMESYNVQDVCNETPWLYRILRKQGIEIWFNCWQISLTQHTKFNLNNQYTSTLTPLVTRRISSPQSSSAEFRSNMSGVMVPTSFTLLSTEVSNFSHFIGVNSELHIAHITKSKGLMLGELGG
jgi:hypothetical protein